MERAAWRYHSIPDGFDLKKYGVCSGWRATDWYFALKWRKVLLYEHFVGPNKVPGGISDSEIAKSHPLFSRMASSLMESLDKLIQEPLVYGDISLIIDAPLSDQSVLDFYSSHLLRSYSEIDGGYSSAAEVIEGAFASRMGELDYPLTLNSLLAWGESEPELMRPAWCFKRDVGYDPFGDRFGDRFFVGVNLEASDEALVDQFRKWIEKTRKESGVKALKRKLDYTHLKSWHTLKFLPYLDLIVWAAANGFKIDARDIFDALYRERHHVSSDPIYVQDQIHKKALKLLKDETFNELRLMAALEQGGR